MLWPQQKQHDNTERQRQAHWDASWDAYESKYQQLLRNTCWEACWGSWIHDICLVVILETPTYQLICSIRIFQSNAAWVITSSRNLNPLHRKATLCLFEVVKCRSIGHAINIRVTWKNLSVWSVTEAHCIHGNRIWCSFFWAGQFRFLQHDCKKIKAESSFSSKKRLTYCTGVHKPYRYLTKLLIRQLGGNPLLVVNGFVQLQLYNII